MIEISIQFKFCSSCPKLRQKKKISVITGHENVYKMLDSLKYVVYYYEQLINQLFDQHKN